MIAKFENAIMNPVSSMVTKNKKNNANKNMHYYDTLFLSLTPSGDLSP